MNDQTRICSKIRRLYPEVGQCGVDVRVVYDVERSVWVVDLKHGNKRLKTFLENEDALDCIEDERCVALGAQISQLIHNIGS